MHGLIFIETVRGPFQYQVSMECKFGCPPPTDTMQCEAQTNAKLKGDGHKLRSDKMALWTHLNSKRSKLTSKFTNLPLTVNPNQNTPNCNQIVLRSNNILPYIFSSTRWLTPHTCRGQSHPALHLYHPALHLCHQTLRNPHLQLNSILNNAFLT